MSRADAEVFKSLDCFQSPAPYYVVLRAKATVLLFIIILYIYIDIERGAKVLPWNFSG